jgi:hypothetical protein
VRDSIARLAERAGVQNWTHEEYLAACLQREVSARESQGGEGRIRAARFPARKSLKEFDFNHARCLKRDTIAHPGPAGGGESDRHHGGIGIVHPQLVQRLRSDLLRRHQGAGRVPVEMLEMTPKTE